MVVQTATCPLCQGAGFPETARVRAPKGFWYWTATVFTLGVWAVLRAMFGRSTTMPVYRCSRCSRRWPATGAGVPHGYALPGWE
jgi:hypothetical protein